MVSAFLVSISVLSRSKRMAEMRALAVRLRFCSMISLSGGRRGWGVVVMEGDLLSVGGDGRNGDNVKWRRNRRRDDNGGVTMVVPLTIFLISVVVMVNLQLFLCFVSGSTNVLVSFLKLVLGARRWLLGARVSVVSRPRVGLRVAGLPSPTRLLSSSLRQPDVVVVVITRSCTQAARNWGSVHLGNNGPPPPPMVTSATFSAHPLLLLLWLRLNPYI